MRDPLSVIELDIRADIERVEGVLRENAESDQKLVHDAAKHLIDAGGKRFRPMLTLLAGFLGDAKDPRLVPCAAAIELTHLATLYHDDVIEEATVRRGVPTVNAQYGNSVAVLTGDFLLARASGLAADLGSYVSRRLADTIAALCEGQIMETGALGDMNVTPDHYLAVIRRKTAALIETACHLGAWLAGASDEQVAAISTYGDAIGMAFQLSDDVLDITGTEEQIGKTPGTDIRAGVLTLPVLLTLGGDAAGGDELRASIEGGNVERALEILKGNGSTDTAHAASDEWVARALAALEPIPAGPARDGFEALAGFIGARTT